MKIMTDQELKIENAHWQTSVMLRALDVFGCDAQMMQTMEECAELTAALSHLKRFRTPEARQEVIEELADVQIMCEQMKMEFDCHQEVTAKVVEKLARLQRRLDEHAKENL